MLSDLVNFLRRRPSPNLKNEKLKLKVKSFVLSIDLDGQVMQMRYILVPVFKINSFSVRNFNKLEWVHSPRQLIREARSYPRRAVRSTSCLLISQQSRQRRLLEELESNHFWQQLIGGTATRQKATKIYRTGQVSE